MHTLSGEWPPLLAVGGDAVVQPGRRHRGVHRTAGQCRPVQAAQTGRGRLVAGDDPGRNPGVGFGIVFAQTTIGGLTIQPSLLRGGRGVVVVADAPPRQPRNRQHRGHCPEAQNPGQTARPGGCFGRAPQPDHHQYCTPCQCAEHFLGLAGGGRISVKGKGWSGFGSVLEEVMAVDKWRPVDRSETKCEGLRFGAGDSAITPAAVSPKARRHRDSAQRVTAENYSGVRSRVRWGFGHRGRTPRV
jgi:hypothetical protein